jgi:hypothetical protein
MTVTSVRSNEHEWVLSHVCERVASALERDFWKWTAAFLVFWLVCWSVQDLRLKMWNDEIFTLYVAQLGNPALIINGIKSGMDATPPLYPILVSAILPLVRPDALAVRLPSTLGFSAMLFFVLAFCRRRMPAIYGFIAALLLIMGCVFYATEGRSYGLVMGCAAGALSCWQSAAEDTRRVVWLVSLSLFLTFATALHYYSIFLLLPLGLGELLRWREKRRPDIPMLLTMLPTLVVLGLHYPLIAAGKRYLTHFWLPGIASWRQIPEFYLQYGAASVAVMLVGLIALAMRPRVHGDKDSRDRVLPSHEWLAIVTLALAPIVVVAISRYTTHVFLPRYTTWAAIGLAIFGASVLCACTGRGRLAGTAVLAVLLITALVRQVHSLQEKPVLRQGDAILRQLQSLPNGPEPIVIAYNHAFIELSYYAGAPLRSRLVYPLDHTTELRYKGSDLDYLLLSGMRAHTALRIVDLEAFLRTNSEFLVAARPQDYLPQYLAAKGYRFTPISSDSEASVFRVQAPRNGID